MNVKRIAALSPVALLAFAGCSSGSNQASSDWEEQAPQVDTAYDSGESSISASEAIDAVNEREVVKTGSLTLQADDASAVSEKIVALEASTERLLDLMTEAESSEALISAENGLSERQADLESLRSERTYLGDQVAMSTLDISVISERTVEFKPGGFLGRLTSGWQALVTFASATLVALGAALP